MVDAHLLSLVYDRMLEACAAASAAELHPRQERSLKPYKVSIPYRGSIGLDHFLHSNGITLGALIQAYVEMTCTALDDGLDEYPILSTAVVRAREIDARRRRRR
jgi:hypothetical protein